MQQGPTVSTAGLSLIGCLHGGFLPLLREGFGLGQEDYTSHQNANFVACYFYSALIWRDCDESLVQMLELSFFSPAALKTLFFFFFAYGTGISHGIYMYL